MKDWKIQEKFYTEEIKQANDLNVYKWSIFLKNTETCIGRLSCQERSSEDSNITDSSIRGVGWYIDPKYQHQGYATEAAKAMIDYMFKEVEINEIITGAAIINIASWKIMEKLGFERQLQTDFVQYTYLDNLTEDYRYILTKEMYLKTII